jgi:hypothetical protein
MKNFKIGDQVSWIKKMAGVPHPEGLTDRDGNVLPVFRDTKILGRVVQAGALSGLNKTWFVRPVAAESHADKICGERYYDVNVNELNLSHS